MTVNKLIVFFSHAHRSMKGLLRLISILFVIGAISGLALSVLMPMQSVFASGISIDRTDDPAVTASGAGAAACTAAANDCSLRGATLYANVHPGTTINAPAGTYQLSIDGASEGGNCLDEKIGDLDIAGNNTSIVGVGAAVTIIQQTRPNDRVICVDQNLVGNFNFSISGVTITGGRDTFGICGGGMVSGYPGDVTTVTNVVFSNNLTSGGSSPWGGGLCNGAGALTVSGSTFASNQATGIGGGLYYSNNGTPDPNTLSLDSSTFSNNVSGANGGGVLVTNTSSAYSVTKNTFINNTASGSGNAIYNESGTLNASYNRFVNPAAGNDVYGNTGATNITNNWWGCNGGPGATGCDTVGGLGVTYNPWIILKTTASPSTINSGQSTTLTASVLQNSSGGVLTSGQTAALIGVPVTWSNAVNGSFSGSQTVVQANGMATTTFTHDALGCSGASGQARIDNVQNADANATVSITVLCPITTVTALTRLSASPTNNSSVAWQVVFADPVSGLSASNFSLVNTGLGGSPAISSVTATSGPPSTTWNITANTGTGAGTLGLNMVNSTGLSHAVTNLPFTGEVYSIDHIGPATTSFKRQTPASNPTNADTLVFRVTFSEAVTNVDTADFAVSGTTAAPGSIGLVSPGVYDVSVSGGDLAGYTGNVGLNFSPGMSITDLAGNPVGNSEPATDETYTVDNTAPTVTINQAAGQADPTNSSPIHFTVVFSEAVSGFGAGDVDLSASTGGGAGFSTIISGSGTTYEAAVSGMASGNTVVATIPSSAAIDVASNPSAASTSSDNSVLYDTNPPSFTVTPSVVGHGTISPDTPQTVAYNATIIFTIQSDAGYYLDSASGCGGSLDLHYGDQYTTGPITADCTVSADFEPNWYTVETNPPLGTGGGTISPQWQFVKFGETTSFTVTPATGSYIASISGCGGSLSGNTYTTGPISGDCYVSVNFDLDTYTVTPSAEAHGTITPDTPQTVAYNATTIFTIRADVGYYLDSASGCGGSLDLHYGDQYTTGPITADCTVSADFEPNWYTVATRPPLGTGNGTISPNTQFVKFGETTSFNVTPDTGSYIASITGCGGSLNGNTYTTSPISGDCDVSVNFDLDTIAPDTSITSETPTLTPTNSTSITFVFSGSDSGSGVKSFKCDLDGGGFAACTSPRDYSGLSEDSHTFQVKATDNVGNEDLTPAAYTWVVDTIRPDTSIDSESPSTSPTKSTSVAFTFSGADPGGSGVTSFECSLDSASFSACASPKNYNSLVDDSHTFQVRAIDAVGNVDSTPAAYTWVVDTIRPDTSIDSETPSTSPTKSTTMDFTFSGSDPGGSGVAGFICDLDGGGNISCSSPQDYAGPLADGPHTFQVRAIDTAGNVDVSPASFTWTVDTTAPILSLPADITLEATSLTGATVTFSATANDLRDGSVAVTCIPPSGSTFPLGATTVNCSATDQALNTANGSFKITVNPSTNANLSALVASTGAFSPVFDPATITYTQSVANAITDLTVTPTSASVGATIQVRINGGAWSAVPSGSPTTALSLDPGTNPIDVQVTAADGITTKTYTNTVARMFAVPSTVSPAGTITDTHPTYVWNAVSGATLYDLYVYSEDNSGYVVSTTSLSASSICSADTCSYTPAVSLTGIDYFFKVRGKSITVTGPFSPYRYFSVGVIPAAPTTLSPTGMIAETQPTYVWNAVTGATYYDLYVYSYNSASYVVSATFLPASSICFAGTCSYTPTVTLTSTDYFFKVNARNFESAGPYSPYRYFTVGTAPAAPTTVSPTGTISETTPTYVWNAISGATWYDLYVYSYDSASYVVSTTSLFASSICSAGTCSYTPAVSLTGIDYFFKVRARNVISAGSFSPYQKFAVGVVPVAPTTVSPTGTSSDTTPTYVWNAVSGATYYNLYVYSYDTSSYVVSATFLPASTTCSGSTCSYTPAVGLTGIDYFFKVNARNIVTPGPYSPYQKFAVGVVPVAPATISPTGTISETQPAYIWNAVAGASQYDLYVYLSTSSSAVVSATSLPASTTCSGGTCSYTPATALVNGIYKFRVRAKNIVSSSPYSAYRYFTVSH